jgi:hypothetical protein
VMGLQELVPNRDSRKEAMDFFERFPVLLVPIIIVTTEVWDALKRLVAARRMGTSRTDSDGSAP